MKPAAAEIAQTHKIGHHRRHRQARGIEQAGSEEPDVKRGNVRHRAPQPMPEGRDRVVGAVGERARRGERTLAGGLVDERLGHVELVMTELQHHRTTSRGVCFAGV